MLLAMILANPFSGVWECCAVVCMRVVLRGVQRGDSAARRGIPELGVLCGVQEAAEPAPLEFLWDTKKALAKLSANLGRGVLVVPAAQEAAWGPWNQDTGQSWLPSLCLGFPFQVGAPESRLS